MNRDSSVATYDPRAPIKIDTMPQGVAAGDVTEDSVVLWAHTVATGRISFQVFEDLEDGRLKRVAGEREHVVDPDEPVKVLVDDLNPGTDYIYRVRDATGTVEEGRFSTAAADGNNGLRFGITGDWRGELAPYAAIKNAAGMELDFFLLGGDTIYADFPSPALPIPQASSIQEFRAKYEEVYGSRGDFNFFEELRESTAIYAVIDDHEVTNDFAGGGIVGLTGEDEFREYFPDDFPLAYVNDSTLYENGLQAFHDYHPIAERFYGDTGDDRTAFERELYRSQTFGDDAAVFVLDQRSFRDEQIEGVLDPTDIEAVLRFELESRDPRRTLLGEVQLEQLKSDLLEAEADGVTWKFVYTPEPIQDLGLNNADSWDGYQAERIELLSFIDENDIDNVVFVAADIHATFVNNITYAPLPSRDPADQIASSAWEITTGPVAFDPPFGPMVIEVAAQLGLLPPEQVAFYESLPIAPDGDALLNDKDDFIRAIFNQVALNPSGLDPLGLDENLPHAEGLIDAELLRGGWVSAHTYGWTEFDIDAETQALTVTTWGIDFYTEEAALLNPAAIAELEPRIVSQFVVNPQGFDQPDPNVIEATPTRERLEGTDRVDCFVFELDDSTRWARDLIENFGAGDKIDLTDFGFHEIVLGGGRPEEGELRITGRDGNLRLVGGDGDDALVLRVEGEIADVISGLVLEEKDTLLS